MSRVKRNSCDESDRELEQDLKLAVEQYKKNVKPERKKDSKKDEVEHARKKDSRKDEVEHARKKDSKKDEVEHARKKDSRKDEVEHARKKGRNKSKERCTFLTDILNKRGDEMKGLKVYEGQGAIPKKKNNDMKGNDSKGKRNNSQSRVSRSPSGRQSNRKLFAEKENSKLDKDARKNVTGSQKANVHAKFLQSFYYIVPEEPSPDFFLSPGTYYVVSTPVDLNIESVILCHPQRSEKHLPRDVSKGDKRHRETRHVVDPTRVNDLNKNKLNCSNVNLVKDLISEYNSEDSKMKIFTKLKTLKPDLEAEIEELKSALTESTIALDQLKVLEFSLNCTLSKDKELGNKELNIKEDFKGTESFEENGVEIESPVDNCSVNEGDDGGRLDVTPVENSLENNELARSSEEITEAKDEDLPLPDNGNQGMSADEFNEERLQEDLLQNRILQITSLLPDICEIYLRTELQKMGDDSEAFCVFIDNLIEEHFYPKNDVDWEEIERKKLWKDYVTDFNPKKFLFETLSASNKGATASNIDSDDGNDLDIAFLRTRYPSKSIDYLTGLYEKAKNLEAVCESLDEEVEPVRLSESTLCGEKFNKEFLIKVTYLDHQREIDDFLTESQKRKELERAEAKLWNSFLECLTCFDKIVPSETTTCRDGHIFCSSCVEKYIRVELGKGIYKFKCFSENCDSFFGNEILEELLPASTLSKISQKQQAEEIMAAKVDGLESCSFCDFVYIPDPDDKIFKCRNPDCMAEICRECHERSHIPLRCNEIERPKDVEARKKVEEIMTNALVRSCPNCKKKIVKIDGCNKMSCTCGTFFCYLCQQEISGYSHFGTICPLHSGNTELHIRRVEEAGIQARDELLRENPEIRFVHDPTQGI